MTCDLDLWPQNSNPFISESESESEEIPSRPPRVISFMRIRRADRQTPEKLNATCHRSYQHRGIKNELRGVETQWVENLAHHVFLDKLSHENRMRCDYHFITSFGIDLTLQSTRKSSHEFIMEYSDVSTGTMKDSAHWTLSDEYWHTGISLGEVMSVSQWEHSGKLRVFRLTHENKVKMDMWCLDSFLLECMI